MASTAPAVSDVEATSITPVEVASGASEVTGGTAELDAASEVSAAAGVSDVTAATLDEVATAAADVVAAPDADVAAASGRAGSC